ncbi:WD40 repeat domain-containing protein [Denitrobaculum tricleocarpae]|uniref:WD40 repeat domain-containing protein n=1 Tax=Denitrobaculum tricleocarpae TaxID=2591009 RepID=A0A545U143_9PROT|nr:WD40 repeat domain-containing protein [Denitrobaculum tricleocarpae]TQV83199.1 WD40 repeat domain-containing protein [Denitrobaculum tricleocarpae]
MDTSSWNGIGRRVALHNLAELKAVHEDAKPAPSFMEDTRSPELAETVLQKVVSLNAEGRSGEVRRQYDPAHAPFIPELEMGGRGLSQCAILGPDEFLVCQGTPFSEMTTWHIKDGSIEVCDPLQGFTWSRNRKFFLSIQHDGRLIVSRGFGETPLVSIPSVPGSAFIPEGLTEELRLRLEFPHDSATYTHISISDDGEKILLADFYRGVILLSKRQSDWTHQLLFPSLTFGLEEQMREDLLADEKFRPFLDMLHAALSPDGRFAAFGTQTSGHHVVCLDDLETPTFLAELGTYSDYPHDVCFSDDSLFLATNSCSFYNGVTYVTKLTDIEDRSDKKERASGEDVILNDYLRVYASGYLPLSMTAEETGAFLLAGAGFAACVTPDRKLLWEVEFGSSAGDVDVCPSTGRVLIASYSGMLHLFDPSKRQEVPIFAGYQAPLEERRWLFWDRLERPIVW